MIKFVPFGLIFFEKKINFRKIQLIPMLKNDLENQNFAIFGGSVDNLSKIDA